MMIDLNADGFAIGVNAAEELAIWGESFEFY